MNSDMLQLVMSECIKGVKIDFSHPEFSHGVYPLVIDLSEPIGNIICLIGFANLMYGTEFKLDTQTNYEILIKDLLHEIAQVKGFYLRYLNL